MIVSTGFEGVGSVSPEECLCIFLVRMGQGVTYENLRYNFQRSLPVLSTAVISITNIFYKVLYLKYVVDNPISWFDARTAYIRSSHHPDFDDCFENVVGAIDGTHIPAYYHHDDIRKIDRSGNRTQNVLLVIDMLGQFRCVGIASGNCHDSTLYGKMKSRWKLPQNCQLLGDAGFAYSNVILTPYPNTRYHLKEWGLVPHLQPKNEKELFNKRHSSIRMIVEMAIGHLKSSWKILDKARMTFIHFVPTIFALLGLYNFVLQDEKNFNIADNLEKFVQEQAKLREEERHARERRVAAGFGPETEEGADERAVDITEVVYEGTTMTRDKRNAVAKKLWERYQAYLIRKEAKRFRSELRL